MPELPFLTDAERARYEWQMWTPDVGEEGQRTMEFRKLPTVRDDQCPVCG